MERGVLDHVDLKAVGLSKCLVSQDAAASCRVAVEFVLQHATPTGELSVTVHLVDPESLALPLAELKDAVWGRLAQLEQAGRGWSAPEDEDLRSVRLSWPAWREHRKPASSVMLLVISQCVKTTEAEAEELLLQRALSGPAIGRVHTVYVDLPTLSDANAAACEAFLASSFCELPLPQVLVGIQHADGQIELVCALSVGLNSDAEVSALIGTGRATEIVSAVAAQRSCLAQSLPAEAEQLEAEQLEVELRAEWHPGWLCQLQRVLQQGPTSFRVVLPPTAGQGEDWLDKETEALPACDALSPLLASAPPETDQSNGVGAERRSSEPRGSSEASSSRRSSGDRPAVVTCFLRAGPVPAPLPHVRIAGSPQVGFGGEVCFVISVRLGELEWQVRRSLRDFELLGRALDAESRGRELDAETLQWMPLPWRGRWGSRLHWSLRTARWAASRPGAQRAALMAALDVFLGSVSREGWQCPSLVQFLGAGSNLSATTRVALPLPEVVRRSRWGDLLLFRCRMRHSVLQRALTRAQFDHVAVVVQIPPLREAPFGTIDHAAWREANPIDQREQPELVSSAGRYTYLLEATRDGVACHPLAQRLKQYGEVSAPQSRRR